MWLRRYPRISPSADHYSARQYVGVREHSGRASCAQVGLRGRISAIALRKPSSNSGRRHRSQPRVDGQRAVPTAAVRLHPEHRRRALLRNSTGPPSPDSFSSWEGRGRSRAGRCSRPHGPPCAPQLQRRICWSPAGRVLILLISTGNSIRWRLKGWLTPDELADRMTRASALVIPSQFEVAPVVLGEAWALGLPVVATAVGGMRTLAEGAAIVVPRREPAALARGNRARPLGRRVDRSARAGGPRRAESHCAHAAPRHT